MVHLTLINTSGGVSKTIKAGYFKMGVANFLFHPGDGYAATAILIEYEERD